MGRRPQRRPPETLDELREMLTPEMWADLRRGAEMTRKAMTMDMPDRLVALRSFCLGFVSHWELPDDHETVSGVVALLIEQARGLEPAAGDGG